MNVREDLRPGTEKAEKISRMLTDNFKLSHRHVSLNYPIWDDLEMFYRSYRLIDDEDRESEEKYGVRKIIVPIQFATIQTMLTFMMEVFTALKPVLRIRGADPASVKKARIMELCLDYDYRGNRGYLLLQQWFLNTFRYGFGVMENTWGTRSVIRKMLVPGRASTFNLEGQDHTVPGPLEYRNEPFTTFEGNIWNIVDNRKFYPDPRVPLANFQRGNFCGHQNYIHDMELAELENDDIIFNTKYIKQSVPFGSGHGSEVDERDHNRDRWRGASYLEGSMQIAQKDQTHVHEQIIVKIIPRDYELSSEDRPQDWLFRRIDGQVIVAAEPNPYQKFPYAVAEAYPDILAFMSQGVMEFTQPLAQHLNFLFNSHMANVRRIIKDMILVDPSRIDIRDLIDNQDGGFVRLLNAGYGQDPSQFAKQLSIQDVTSGHMVAAKEIREMWGEFTGATSHMFGQISSGRRTAYELQGVFRQAGARMKMQADLMSAEGVAPLTEQMAMLRQENMSREQFMEVAGYSALDLGVDPDQIIEGFLSVGRDHINGVFNYPAEEGVLPQDRAQMAETLDKMMDRIAQNPFLGQVFDIVTIFKETVRQGGIHNIDDFLNRAVKVDTAIMTPDQIGELMARNKLVATNSNGQPGRPDEGVTQDRSTLGIEGFANGAGASYR